MPAIEANNITKNYGKVRALDNLSLEVNDGELFGLIGPDGAGKSTLFRILTTLLLADKGSARVAGRDIVKQYREIRRSVGYMPGRFSLYQDLSVEENLHFFATIFGTSIKENYELIRDIYVQIAPFKDRPAGKLSGGMKQKLALCCALIHKPEVLFLDEPTTGVDAVSRKEFWEMLKKLKDSGIAILVSTPYMDEAGMCDRIALIQKGSVLSIDTPGTLIKSFDKTIYAVKSGNTYRLLQALRNMDFTETVLPFGEYLHLTPRENIEKGEILRALDGAGFSDVVLNKTEPTVEDVFLALSSEEPLINP
jgi:ABC-type multidrug transport system ATPase subunit